MRHAYIPFGYYTMIVGEPPSALRRPGQAFGLPNHYTMIVGEPPLALRRPGQAFGLPNHYTIIPELCTVSPENPNIYKCALEIPGTMVYNKNDKIMNTRCRLC